MSSESYVRWELQRKEALRKAMEEEKRRNMERMAQLKGLSRELDDLGAWLSTKDATDTPRQYESETLSNVYDVAQDTISEVAVDTQGLYQAKGIKSQTSEQGEILDWSAQLLRYEVANAADTKKNLYAQGLSAQLSAMVQGKTAAVALCKEFDAYQKKLLEDTQLDMSYFEFLLHQRFVQLKKTMAETMETNTQDQLEYQVLCQLLDMKPQPWTPAQRSAEIKRLNEELFQRRQEAYVYQQLKEVFAQLNLTMTGEEDSVLGVKIVDDTLDNCALYMSADSQGFLFETVGEVAYAGSISQNQRALVETSARTICKKHLEVIRLMAERGILLTVDCETEPDGAAMQMRRKRAETSRTGSKQATNQMEM